MIRTIKRKTAALLSCIMLLSILAGCGARDKVSPDTYMVISVSAEMLMQAEDPEPVKSVDELYQIIGTKSYGGYNFLELEPGEALLQQGMEDTTLYISDEKYFNALAQAKDVIYIDPTMAYLTDSATVYQAVRSQLLSDYTYDTLIDLIDFDCKYFLTPRSVSEDTSEEEITDAVSIEDEEILPETSEDINSDAPEEEDMQPEDIQPEENIEDGDTEALKTTEEALEGENTEEDVFDDTSWEDPLWEDPEEYLNGLYSDKALEMRASLQFIIDDYYTRYMYSDSPVRYSEAELSRIVAAYMEFRNFAIYSDIVVYSLEDERLGNYTASQLNSYYCYINGINAPYDLQNGYGTLSELLPGVIYETQAHDNQNGNFAIHLKNDTKQPVYLHVSSNSISADVVFLTDTFKLTGYYPENEWSNNGQDITYVFWYEVYENDEQLAATTAQNPDTLLLGTLTPDEKGRYEDILSQYRIIINDTKNTFILTSDTKEEEVFVPGKVILVHPEMYSYFKITIQEEEE